VNKFSVIILSVVVVFLIALVAGFVYLEGAGRPTSTFVIFATGLVGPILAVLPVVYKQQETARKIDTIGRNVNGNTTRLFDAATGGEPLQDDERARILGDLRQLPSHPDQQPPRHAAE
jgi:uncharacterized membrane protein